MVDHNSSFSLVLHSTILKTNFKERNYLMSMHKNDAKILGFIIISFVVAGCGGVILAIGLVIAAGR